MRTRRYFQPTLDGMPARIAPSAAALHAVVASAATLHAVVASASTVANGTTSSAHPSGGSLQVGAGSQGTTGMHVDDSTDPDDTATGDGAAQIIIQPVSVASILIC
jgi:hypothetical protein